MRTVLSAAAFLLLAACSSAPVETAKEPEKAPEPRSGRMAIQSTFPTARGWAKDAEPLQGRNLHLKSQASGEGKAFAWEVIYVSQISGSQRAFVWSSVTAEGLNEGVYGGPSTSWRAGGQKPVPMASIKIDTADALAAAMEKASSYLKKPGDKPPVTFMLEFTTRYPSPVWRVMWGTSAAASEYTVFVDATNGTVLGTA